MASADGLDRNGPNKKRTRNFITGAACIPVLLIVCFGVFLTAGCEAPPVSDFTYHIFKINATGTPEWQTTFTAPDGNYYSFYQQSQPFLLSDGSLIIIDRMLNFTYIHQTYYKIYKIDKHGNLIWTKEYLNQSDVGDARFLSFVELPNTVINVCNEGSSLSLFTISSNGSLLGQEYGGGMACKQSRVVPEENASVLAKVVDNINQTQHIYKPTLRWDFWEVRDGYAFGHIQSPFRSSPIIIHMKFYDAEGNVTMVHQHIWPYNSWYSESQVAWVGETNDGGFIIVVKLNSPR